MKCFNSRSGYDLNGLVGFQNVEFTAESRSRGGATNHFRVRAIGIADEAAFDTDGKQ